jgi:hypothetical protein
MRFYNINIEGPDCSGKTTMFNRLHQETNFKYNIQDRSTMSMYVYACLYNRPDRDVWFNRIVDDLKRLDTLYVVLLPGEDIILKRLDQRGDEFQNASSIVKVRALFNNLVKCRFGSFPNVLCLEETDLNKNIGFTLDFVESLNEMPGQDLIKSLVVNSGQNEIIDVQCKERIDVSSIDYSVLDFPQEKEYYKKITEKMENKIFKEFAGLNENNVPQSHNTRRIIYTSSSCISFIHGLFRDNALNISVTLRSSNVIQTLWADYEFLKILSLKIANEMSLPEDVIVDLTVNIRSAHIVP